jgi:predicted P-loop ATPase
VRVLEHDPALAGQVWYDAFLGRVLHTWGGDKPAQWTDADDLRLTLYLQREVGIGKMAKGTAADAAYTYARRETRNCAYDWLDGLRWDHRERLQDLATRGFGCELGEYNAAVCRNMILAMVKRVFEPGCKSDYMPILEGEQGIGKSQALGILGGEWFAELHLSWETKDFFDALRGKMLLEIGEMHAFRQSDVDRIKGIVSCATDRYRASYGRHTEDYPCCCVFVGTTNRDDWNRDDTGARRFWPVRCGAIDHGWLRDNRDQLFAEAVHLIRDGATHWEVPWGDASREQDERRAEDPWEPVLREWAIGKSRLQMGDVLTDCLKIEAARQSLGDMQRAGRCLKKLGWRKTVPTEPGPTGKRSKIWVREDESTDPKKGESDLFAD